MNIRIVIKTVSVFLIFIAFVMLCPFICAIILHEKEWVSFIISSLLTACVGGLGFISNMSIEEKLFRREGFAVVGFGWLIGSLFGALPFFLSGSMGLIDSYFETVSGFTTTGSTILTNIEILPKSLLFWRSMTQWLGGMGIIVLFVAVFPYLGVSGKQLFKSEASAAISEGMHAKIRETARSLWYVYIGLTISLITLLHIGGVSIFDSICHTFTTLSTGGFSTYNASIAAFNSLYVEIIIMIFMVLSGINFFVLHSLLTGKIKKSSGLSELKTYLIIILAASLIVSLSLVIADYHQSIFLIFRKSFFQVISIMTTTGFITYNYDLWPSFAQVILVLLMFVGGCAGSTGGGIKVIRFQVAFKFMYNQIFTSVHPGAVKSVKISEHTVPDEQINEIICFFLISFCAVIFFTLIMTLTNLDIVTAFSAVVATLWNIGPGLAKVGAVENFGFISNFGKMTLSLCMILGRLEFFAIIVMLLPSFWKK